MCKICMIRFHVSCMGMKDANMTALGLELLVLLCRQCLNKSLDEWRNQGNDREASLDHYYYYNYYYYYYQGEDEGGASKKKKKKGGGRGKVH